MRRWTLIGSLGAALSVACGAFGAHALEARLDPAALDLWETAARYLMYGSLGLIGLGIAESSASRPLSSSGAGWALSIGSLIFSSTVAALALGGPRWLGAITPIGGVLLILGFVLFAVAARRS